MAKKLAEKAHDLAAEAHNQAEKARRIADEKNRLAETEREMKESVRQQILYEAIKENVTIMLLNDAEKGRYGGDYDAGSDEAIARKVMEQLRLEGFSVKLNENDMGEDYDADEYDRYKLVISWEKPKK